MSSLYEGPLIRVVSWPNNVCTVERTNFMVQLDPMGMAAVLDIDPEVRIFPRFLSLAGIDWFRETFPGITRAGWEEKCGTLEGYTRFYDYVAKNLESTRGFMFNGVVNGFMFEVDVRKDSPLVGWFLVLGVNRE